MNIYKKEEILKRKEIGKWVKKSSESKNLVVMLIPARTDTKYFHDYIYHKADIRFIKGRLKFEGNQKGSGSAPFPSMIVIFNKK
jgi:site-specific DNA-methyltransferase (adenine-specific)